MACSTLTWCRACGGNVDHHTRPIESVQFDRHDVPIFDQLNRPLLRKRLAGVNESGIVAFNAGMHLIINSSAGTVSGSGTGVDALNFGTGALNITTADAGPVAFKTT